MQKLSRIPIEKGIAFLIFTVLQALSCLLILRRKAVNTICNHGRNKDKFPQPSLYHNFKKLHHLIAIHVPNVTFLDSAGVYIKGTDWFEDERASVNCRE